MPPSPDSEGDSVSRRQSSRDVAACAYARAAVRSPQFTTGQPVYSRACSNEGRPPSKSAMTSRLNQQLPRQDLHLLACQRTKAALSSDHLKMSVSTPNHVFVCTTFLN